MIYQLTNYLLFCKFPRPEGRSASRKLLYQEYLSKTHCVALLSDISLGYSYEWLILHEINACEASKIREKRWADVVVAINFFTEKCVYTDNPHRSQRAKGLQ